MTVIATRRRTDRVVVEDGVTVHPAGDLPTLLPRARVVLVCLPLTGETRGLLGEREFALLPSSAVLVNVARGPIVDEEALFSALRDGRLHSAGIDTWYRYPGREGNPMDTAPSRLPFGELENVVMSPHRGGSMPATEARRMETLGDLLRTLAEGREAPGRVDLEAGY
jgi:phosphoglycerate dehydrogenase-like enzyme